MINPEKKEKKYLTETTMISCHGSLEIYLSTGLKNADM